MLRDVAILYHPLRPQAVAEAQWLFEQLCDRGVRASIGDGWDQTVVDRLCCDRELAVAFGGDGTIIHVARLAARYGAAVVGVNLGRVGFLAELTPKSMHEQIDALIEGRFWVERRSMLDVELRHGSGSSRTLCLNEAAVSRGVSAHAIHVDTLLDDELFMTYTADAVLAATATGSTAYSLAAGGPILYPESTDILITPVAPHLHIGRTTVVPGDATVTLRLATNRPAVLTVDGVVEKNITSQDTVRVFRSDTQVLFARLGPRSYFYSALRNRLQ